MKRFIALFCSVLLVLTLAACGGDKNPDPVENDAPSNVITGAPGVGDEAAQDDPSSDDSSQPDMQPADGARVDDSEITGGTDDVESDRLTYEDVAGKYEAQIDIESYGTIELELDADVAPVTVANFINLANEGFYDGLTFHRIIDGFMIQGGDPLGNGTGGSGEDIYGEFGSNGWENNISHERGVISMARSNHPDSASSQFFIMHADAGYLDGEYAAFGHVINGIEIVDAICSDAEPVDDNGTILKDAQPVIARIRVIVPEA